MSAGSCCCSTCINVVQHDVNCSRRLHCIIHRKHDHIVCGLCSWALPGGTIHATTTKINADETFLIVWVLEYCPYGLPGVPFSNYECFPCIYEPRYQNTVASLQVLEDRLALDRHLDMQEKHAWRHAPSVLDAVKATLKCLQPLRRTIIIVFAFICWIVSDKVHHSPHHA